MAFAAQAVGSRILVLCVLAAFTGGGVAVAQQSAVTAQSNASLPSAPALQSDDLPLEQQPHSSPTLANSTKHGLTDLMHIAVSPIYLRTGDLKWLLPLAGASAAAFATDTHTMHDVVSHDPDFNNAAVNVSQGLLGGFIATPVAMFGVGHMTHNEHMREAGLLGGEAMVDAYVVDEFTKLVTFRERPQVDNAQGEFYIGKAGVNSSFVSGHCMLSWSSAAAISGEYHSRWVSLLAYSAASGVAATRVLGQQHFPTDVLIGSAGGWLIGHYVYRAHHHSDMVR